MIKCICINDKNKPPELSENNWLKIGEEYTVEKIYRIVQPGAIMGVVIKEIDLNTQKDVPFSCFKIDRFGFKEEDLPELMRLIEECKDLKDYEPLNLIEKEIYTGRELTDLEDHIEDESENKPLGEL